MKLHRRTTNDLSELIWYDLRTVISYRHCHFSSSIPTCTLNAALAELGAIASTICATTKPKTSLGRIPAKVCVNERAMVTAGLANDMLAVNQ